MSDEAQEDVATEEEVIAYLGLVADQVAVAVAGGDVRIAEAVLGVISGDEGARALLSAAFNEGRADAIKSMLRRGGTIAEANWSDVPSLGERKMIVREESICQRCTKQPVCIIARSSPDEMLTVISRCAAFA